MTEMIIKDKYVIICKLSEEIVELKHRMEDSTAVVEEANARSLPEKQNKLGVRKMRAKKTQPNSLWKWNICSFKFELLEKVGKINQPIETSGRGRFSIEVNNKYQGGFLLEVKSIGVFPGYADPPPLSQFWLGFYGW